jgi:hypothetical protein
MKSSQEEIEKCRAEYSATMTRKEIADEIAESIVGCTCRACRIWVAIDNDN